MSQPQAQSQSKPAEKPAAERRPRPGDQVHYRPWTHATDPLHAVVAFATGMTVTLAVLTRNGTWLSEGPAPFDSTGTLPGHWSWATRIE